MRLVFVLLAMGFAAPAAAAAEEPNALVAGIWPNQIVFLDQTTDEFVEGFRVKYGAITAASYTLDKRLFFLVTDRMEAVEVVDMAKREVVDELKLSTPERRVRINRVVPDHEGKKLYLTVNVMKLEIDRFVREDEGDVMVYDLSELVLNQMR